MSDDPKLPRRPSGGPRRSPSAQLIAVRGPSASAELSALQERIAGEALAVLRQRHEAGLLATDSDLQTAARWVAEKCRRILADALLEDLQRRPTASQLCERLRAAGWTGSDDDARALAAHVGLELRPEPP